MTSADLSESASRGVQVQLIAPRIEYWDGRHDAPATPAVLFVLNAPSPYILSVPLSSQATVNLFFRPRFFRAEQGVFE